MKHFISATLLLAVLANGCSNIRLGYIFADEYTKYQIADRFDLNGEQKNIAYKKIDDWFAWHKAQEIDPLIALAEEVKQATSDRIVDQDEFDSIYAILDQGRIRYYRKAAPDLIAMLATLSDQQLESFREYMEEDAQEQEDELADTEQERIDERLDDALDTYEDWFGQLTEKQTEFIRSTMDSSDETIARRNESRRSRNTFYYQTLRDHRTDKVYMTRVFNDYIDDPEFFRPEDQKNFDRVYSKARTNIPAFFRLLSEQQLEYFHGEIDALVDDLQSLKD